MVDPDATLRAAERVVVFLHGQGIPSVVIGGIALAAYNYVRFTEDVDLGIDADLPSLRALVIALQKEGFTADLREPDGDDPLGGVIDVSERLIFESRRASKKIVPSPDSFVRYAPHRLRNGIEKLFMP